MNLISQLGLIFNRFVLNKGDGDMLDNVLLQYDKNLKGNTNALKSDETSRPRNKFAGGGMNLKIGFRKLLQMLPISIRQMRSFFESVEKAGEPHNQTYVDKPRSLRR